MSAVLVCAKADLTEGEARQVTAEGHLICLVQLEGEVFAIGDICSHQRIALSEGEVLAGDKAIECWKHGSAFSLLSGEPKSLPANRAVPVFEVRIEDGDVWVEIPDV